MNKEQQPIEAEEVQTNAVAIVPPANPAPASTTTQPPVTAAQAKVEAIADLTHSAYQKAATLALTKEESDALQADFPDEAFKPGADGKENLIYIEHAFLRDRLTQVFGLGQWCIIPRRSWSEKFTLPARYDKPATDGERVYVEAMLVVRGCFVAEAIGDMAYYPKNNAQNYGDAVEGAKTAALRRCCKEFGVGLQAWKKDWCQGWMDRKMHPGKRAFPPKAAAAPAQPDISKRDKFLLGLNAYPVQQILQFCIDLSWLMPNQALSELEDRFLPKTVGEMKAFKNCLDNWMAKGDTVQPYDCPIPEPKKGTPPPKIDIEPPGGWQGATGEPEDSDASHEEWYGVIVPVPHKGQKRDEYLKNPDTIGSLYDARHDDEDARKRLWGFVSHYEPKGWAKHDGTAMPPSKADIQFRESLDQFSDWFEKNHPDEKL